VSWSAKLSEGDFETRGLFPSLLLCCVCFTFKNNQHLLLLSRMMLITDTLELINSHNVWIL